MSACGARPATPPTSVRLSAFASDGENVTLTDETLTLAEECPPEP